MNCPNCGGFMHDGTNYCTNCGSHFMPAQIPIEYKPITAWGYVGYYILYQIPLVGFIIMLINAFGSNTNVHLKNLSRCYLILYVIATILVLAAIIVPVVIGMSANSGASYM